MGGGEGACEGGDVRGPNDVGWNMRRGLCQGGPLGRGKLGYGGGCMGLG